MEKQNDRLTSCRQTGKQRRWSDTRKKGRMYRSFLPRVKKGLKKLSLIIDELCPFS